ncbi:DUF2917 domain-containing protein [Achromobacter mucicolens]|nr:DUF2917 domain-containing protein [Achromobacter mucicolens]
MLLKRASGVRIVCHAGALWISEYRRFDDSVLQAGQTLTVDSDRDVVISGLPDAQVALLSLGGGRCSVPPLRLAMQANWSSCDDRVLARYAPDRNVVRFRQPLQLSGNRAH